MPVFRYRSIAEMPRPWRDADDPANLHAVAEMMALYRRLNPAVRLRLPGVQKFRSVQEADAALQDSFGCAHPEPD